MKGFILLITLSILLNWRRVTAIGWNDGGDGSWAMGCDFYGNDLTNVHSRGEECSSKCKFTSGCTHYTWTNYNGGTCWMKKGSISKFNAAGASGDSVCGLLSSASFSGFQQPPQQQKQPQQTQPSQDSVQFNTINNCPYTIWIGMQGRSQSNPNWKLPMNGGWELKSGQTVSVQVPKDFMAGRLWGRTNCNSNSGQFRCETGDCGPFLQCATGGVQRGGQTPATLAEFTLNGAGNQDFYDVSLVDGYNLKMAIEVTNPSSGEPANYWCKNPSCVTDLNSICPNELRKKNSVGRTVGCLSACEKLGTDQYCCRNNFGTPQTCKSSLWPVNYPAVFKSACPTSYSYAYDDETSTFFCRNTNYNIKFC